MPLIANFGADPTYGLVPLTVQFSDSSIGTITEWLWNFGDDSSSTEQHPIHTYYVADTFTVSLSVSGPGGSDTQTRENYIIVTNPTIVQESFDILPTKFKLYESFPNPFNPSTKIKYSIPYSSKVVIKVFDVLGNEIETLVSQEKPAGTYELTW